MLACAPEKSIAVAPARMTFDVDLSGGEYGGDPHRSSYSIGPGRTLHPTEQNVRHLDSGHWTCEKAKILLPRLWRHMRCSRRR